MAIPIIYKGDDTDFNGGAPITLNIETAFDLSGCRIELSFLGCRREFSGLSGHTATLSVVFSAAETVKMPVGTHCASLRAYDSAGRVRTLTDSVRLRVTDSVDEAAGGSIDVGIGETVEELTPADGLGAVKEVVNKLARLVGASCIAMALCGATSLNDMPGTNTIYTAAETDARILELAPVPDISGKADAANTYTKAETDAKIVELAPAPGNYATVSNRAMSAIQEHQSLWPAVEASTNYTDAAFGAFASTGAVFRAATYGTPTRWTDATGYVWEVVTGWRVYTNGIVAAGWTAWAREVDAGPDGYSYELCIGPDETEGVPITSATFPSSVQNWADEYEVTYGLDYDFYGLTYGDTIRAVHGGTNFVGRVALTNDIPDVSGYATPEDVTAAIREQSLGGIWDHELGVWWTPHMANGAYYWTATTNVNLNAEGN